MVRVFESHAVHTVVSFRNFLAVDRELGAEDLYLGQGINPEGGKGEIFPQNLLYIVK